MICGRCGLPVYWVAGTLLHRGQQGDSLLLLLDNHEPEPGEVQ
jgi:hypothetical protein